MDISVQLTAEQWQEVLAMLAHGPLADEIERQVTLAAAPAPEPWLAIDRILNGVPRHD